MYSYEDRLRAVRLYIKLGKHAGLTIRQLGYPLGELDWSGFRTVSPRPHLVCRVRQSQRNETRTRATPR